MTSGGGKKLQLKKSGVHNVTRIGEKSIRTLLSSSSSSPSRSSTSKEPLKKLSTAQPIKKRGESLTTYPSLPKSRLLIGEKEKPLSCASNEETYIRLPPPDRTYLSRQPKIPLRWTSTDKCSGLVLGDNTVYFIGTRNCEEEIRKRFLNFLEGKDEEEEIVPPHPPPPPPERSDGREIFEKPSISNINQSIPSSSNAPRRNTHELDYSPEDELESYQMKSYEADIEILKEPQALSNFMYDSDSSSDDDLPRVNIHGRSIPPQTSTTSEIKSNRTWLASSTRKRTLNYDSEECWTAKRRKETSFTGTDGGSGIVSDGEAAPSTSGGGSGIVSDVRDSGAASGGGGSDVVSDERDIDKDDRNISGAVKDLLITQNCPICNTSFQLMYSTQYEADEHIALCLSINMNDFGDD